MPVLRTFTEEQMQIIDEWCKKFPSGKSLDFERIKREDGTRWSQMLNHHDYNAIRSKASVYRMRVLKDVPMPPSLKKSYYKPAASKRQPQPVEQAVNGTEPVKQTVFIKFCPHCGGNLQAHHAAANL